MINSPSPFEYRVVGPQDFDSVQTLWEKLKAYHAQLPWHFVGDMHRVSKVVTVAWGNEGALALYKRFAGVSGSEGFL